MGHKLLTGGLTDEKRRYAVEAIDRNAKSQGKIIDDLLDASRIISGRVRLNVEPVEPFDVMQMAIESVRPRALPKA